MGWCSFGGIDGFFPVEFGRKINGGGVIFFNNSGEKTF